MSDRVSGTIVGVGAIRIYVSDCPRCGVLFGITEEFEQRRRDDAATFYCPNGHNMSWHESAADREKKRADKAEIRERHLRDQLEAAECEAEQKRVALVKIQHRIANGVCPCCNRSFDNVRRHIEGQHPDFDPGPATIHKGFECSCGRQFDTFAGLRIHQGRQRPENWTNPNLGSYSRHLTVATAQ